MEYNKVRIRKGSSGWGGPIEIKPDDKKKYVVSVTGGGIHPVAKKIAELTGATAVDSFKNPVATDETLFAVIDCGGTSRSGTYPRMGIPTANVKVGSPAGPLAKFMNEGNYVSDVHVQHIDLIGEDSLSEDEKVKGTVIPVITEEPEQTKIEKTEQISNVTDEDQNSGAVLRIIESIGVGAGKFMNVMYQAGKETIENLIQTIIPFMAFVATLVGIINYTGVGDWIANLLIPLAGSLWGLILLAFITAIPFLSPILAPGAVIAAIIGTLIGQEIASGGIPSALALPALFAINSQVGMDFIPVGMSLGEAQPETVQYGTPAILFSRLVTGPLSIVIAYGLALFFL